MVVLYNMELNGRAPAEENYGVVEMGKNSQLNILCMVKCWEWVECDLFRRLFLHLTLKDAKESGGRVKYPLSMACEAYFI